MIDGTKTDDVFGSTSSVITLRVKCVDMVKAELFMTEGSVAVGSGHWKRPEDMEILVAPCNKYILGKIIIYLTFRRGEAQGYEVINFCWHKKTGPNIRRAVLAVVAII